MIYIELLVITIIVVIILDLTDFVENGIEKAFNGFRNKIDKWVNPKLNRRLQDIKIPNCSLCMSFWIMLCYYLVQKPVYNIFDVLYIIVIAVLMTEPIKLCCIIVKDLIMKILSKIYEKIN